MGNTHYKKPLNWNLTIRWFSIIPRTHVVGRDLPLCRDAVRVFYSPSRRSWRLYGCNLLKYSFINKLATVVEGYQKAPFPIATTPKRRWGHNSFPLIAPLYPWYVPYIAERLARRYQVPFLKSLVWLDLGLNPGLPDNWRTFYPLGQL